MFSPRYLLWPLLITCLLSTIGCSNHYDPDEVFLREVGYTLVDDYVLIDKNESGFGSDSAYDFTVRVSGRDFDGLKDAAAKKSGVTNVGEVYRWSASDQESYVMTFIKDERKAFVQIFLE